MKLSAWTLKSLICTAALNSLFWGSIAQLDLFGATTAADAQSESLFSRVIGGPWYHSTARDRIAVILIDDDYLNEVDSAWPLSYAQQELLLEDLMLYEPSAVFLDMLFQHEHGKVGNLNPGLDQLRERIQKTTSSGTPVFIPKLLNNNFSGNGCAQAAPANTDPFTIAQVTPLLIDSGATPTYIGWSGCAERYPAYVLDNPTLLTPAFALYSQDKMGRADAELPDPADYDQEMMIRWGARTSQQSAEGYEVAGLPPCELLDGQGVMATSLYVLKQVWEVMFQTVSQKQQRGRLNACTHTDSLSALWLLGGGRDDRNRAWLNEMLRDRIVLIGTQINGLHDRIDSPVNGQVPGVFMLAMALDNYLTYGAGYYRDMKWWVAALLEIAVLFCTTVLIGLLWQRSSLRSSIGVHANSNIDTRGPIDLAIKAFAIYKLMIPLLGSLTLAGLAWHLGYAPLNWIAVTLLVFVQNPVGMGDCFGDNDPYHWLTRNSKEK